ncbi:MAG: DUF4362 domain-containing protein [Anaerolineaceae bacterium]|nr:DUF4362 domain-containing protein [Anaerolineaceae bacterium]
MSKRKPVSWVIIVVMGIGLLLKFPHWNAIDLINGPARYLVPEQSEYYKKVLFNILTREIDRLPHIITTEIMEKEGVASILHGTMSEETSSMLDTFVSDSSDGKAAQIIIALYTTEGDPIYINVLFDRVQYLAVIDQSHDSFKGEGEDNENLRYDYLKIITAPETGSEFVILTNDSKLTFEQLRIAQIGSDMESIDSFQLFSYSK